MTHSPEFDGTDDEVVVALSDNHPVTVGVI